MKRNIIIRVLFLLLLFVSVPACEKQGEADLPGDPVQINLSTVEIQLSENCNNFGFDIFRAVVTSDTENENIMISPMSISYALAMTLNGAAGVTRDSIMKALRQDNMSLEEINNSYKNLTEKITSVDRRVALEIANSVWVEDRLQVKQQFIDALFDYFEAEGHQFNISDPGIVEEVNKWISDHTNGLIDEMIEEIPNDVVMLLINAVYFNGKWRYQFDPSDTSKDQFTTLSGSVKEVDMMNLESTYKISTDALTTFVELPYGQGNFVMDVILPEGESDIEDLVARLDAETFNNWVSELRERKINLYMPKFKYRYKTELGNVLSAMGMGIAFSGGADFSNISDQPLAISRVLHESFIDNSEEGTEAAAVTVVMFELTSAPPEPSVIRLDRPFVYVIRESSTGAIIFMGITGSPDYN